MEYKNLDVFVLTYNRAEYLRIMLDSLCTQTAEGFNIKVLNNCSTDNTLEVIEEVKKKYPERNITVITHEKNLGNFGNFKRSQELAENEYTAIFHDDDAIHPEYIDTAMTILNENKNVVMCTGGAEALYNVDNSNWAILYKNYNLYTVKDGVYLNLLLARPVFASNIYLTSAYKKVKYEPDKYGKLHDIIFMCEMNRIGDVAFIQAGNCIRWRQSATNDSNVFNNGPYPQEVANIINKIYILNKQHNFLGKALLWDLAYFLYCWGLLKKYETWEEFQKRLLKSNNVEDGTFSKWEICMFKCKFMMKLIKKVIKKRAKYYRRKIVCKYDSRF